MPSIKGTASVADDHAMTKLLKSTKFPPSFGTKVDLAKVNRPVLSQWIEQQVSKILGFEDEIVSSTAINLFLDGTSVNPRRAQLDLVGFLGADQAATFAESLWDMLIDAQSNPMGIPKTLLEEKKRELAKQQLLQQQHQQRQNKHVDVPHRGQHASQQGRYPPPQHRNDNFNRGEPPGRHRHDANFNARHPSNNSNNRYDRQQHPLPQQRGHHGRHDLHQEPPRYHHHHHDQRGPAVPISPPHPSSDDRKPHARRFDEFGRESKEDETSSRPLHLERDDHDIRDQRRDNRDNTERLRRKEDSSSGSSESSNDSTKRSQNDRGPGWHNRRARSHDSSEAHRHRSSDRHRGDDRRRYRSRSRDRDRRSSNHHHGRSGRNRRDRSYSCSDSEE